jgi:hypothetical protein
MTTAEAMRRYAERHAAAISELLEILEAALVALPEPDVIADSGGKSFERQL